MGTEQDYVRQINEANSKANKAAQRLVWDPVQKRIRPMCHHDPDSSTLDITRQDMGHSGMQGRVIG